MTTSGLDGVVVAQTVLSEVDGEAGRLIVRGRTIEELAGEVPFEEMARLLWAGLAAAEPGTAAEVQAILGGARVVAFANVAELGGTAARLPAVAALRLGLASLRPGAAGAARDHYLAAAAIPVFLAAFERCRRGLSPVAPDPALSQAADLLRMLRGGPARAAEVAALDAYLVTVAEHGMNASTFTARVVASTGAGVLPAVVAALSALEGPLHGGAPGPVLDMLDALAGRTDVRSWLAGELAAGRRLMGFGHRIYRVRDPRADVLKEQVARLRAAGAAAALAPQGSAVVAANAGTAAGGVVAGGVAAAGGVAVRSSAAGGGAAGTSAAGGGAAGTSAAGGGAAGTSAAGGGAAGTSAAGGESRLALAETVERQALAALAELRPGRRLDTNVEFYTAVLLDALAIDRSLFTSLFAAGRVAGWTAHVFEQERAHRLIRPQSEYVGPRAGLVAARA